MRTTAVLAAILTVLLCAPEFEAVAHGQEQAPRPARSKEPEFQKHIAVNYMLVDVIVTDRRGNYIRSLTKGDFILLENGKPVEIESLDEYAMLAPSSAEFAGAEEGAVEFQQPPRSIIIFFDLFFSSGRGIKRAVEAAEEFLNNRIQPGDKVMVLSYHGSLKVVQPFTNDKMQAILAMRALGLSTDGMSLRLEPPEGREPLADESSASNVDDMLTEELKELRAMQAADELAYRQHNARNFLFTFRALGHAVKQYPGRKTLILLSEGLSFDLIAPTQSLNTDFSSGSRVQDRSPSGLIPTRMASLLEDYEKMLAYLNDAKTSIYTVNVGGLKPIGGVETLTHGFDIQAGLPGVVAGTLVSRRSRQDFLSAISRETGGRAYFNQNNILDILNDIEVDISNYYILGYRSQLDSEKSEYRKIKVRPKNRDYRIVHRKGFFTPKPFRDMSRDEKFMQLNEGFISQASMNELNARAVFQPLPLSADTASISICIKTPGEDIETLEGELEYELRAFNDIGKGQIHSSVHKLLKISGPDVGALKKKGIRLVESLDLNPGQNRIRIVLRNNQNGKRTYFSLNRMYRPLREDALLLSAPVFFDTEDMQRTIDQFDVKTVLTGAEDANIKAGADLMVHPVHGKIFPIIDPVFAKGDVVNFFVFVDNLKLIPGEDPKLTVDFWVGRVDESGIITQRFEHLPTKNPQFSPYRGFFRYCFTAQFEAGRILPGKYILGAVVIDRRSERRSKSSTEFTIAERE